MSKSWLQSDVFYRLELRLFQDSVGDGVGDWRGVLKRVDYLLDLGIDVLWTDETAPDDIAQALQTAGLKLLHDAPELGPGYMEGPLEVAALRRFARTVSDHLPALTLGGPGLPRVASRLGQNGAVLAAVLHMTLPGTPVIWFGDEVGMEDDTGPAASPPATMAWDAGPGAGFSTAETSTSADAPFRNVAVQSDSPDSLLNLYRRLIALRKRIPALHRGNFNEAESADGCFAYLREALDAPGNYKRMFVALNPGTEPTHLILPAPGRVMLWSHSPGEDTNLVEVLRVDAGEAAVAVLFA